MYKLNNADDVQYVAQELLNVELCDFQAKTIFDMWNDNGRYVYENDQGLSESYIIGVCLVLDILLSRPNSRTIYCVGPSFRDSKLVFQQIESICRGAGLDYERQLCPDKCSVHIHNNSIICTTIGDGQRLRGLRYDNLTVMYPELINSGILELV